MPESDACACGSLRPYAQCCGQCIDGGRAAETAEQLMRSRYTAFVRGDEAYLRKTWDPATCPGDMGAAVTDAVKWLGLEIRRAEAGGANDAEGVVEFVARYKLGGKATRLHEISRFRRTNGQWLYVNGQFPNAGK
jgi:SEC-C motif-containing protein